jgi:predicted metal-binding membrane protein
MSTQTPVEALLKKERLIVGSALVAITVLAWAWILIGAGTGMNTLAMTSWAFPSPQYEQIPKPWTFAYAIIMFFMWWIMMIAMMTPSAAPTILLYGHAYRHEQNLNKLESGLAPTISFAFGYLLCWAAFSLLATLTQRALESAGLVHSMMMWSVNPWLTAGLLIAVGLYQFTKLKDVCLKHCRSPAQFLAEHFQPGARGALRMGMHHGLFCLGCCWFLMALLFVGGSMNLIWIAAIALFVLLEKLAPYGFWLARGAGAMLIAVGVWMLAQSF